MQCFLIFDFFVCLFLLFLGALYQGKWRMLNKFSLFFSFE